MSINLEWFKQWAELALFDLQCLAAVAAEPTAFANLRASSYMTDKAGEPTFDVRWQIQRLCNPFCNLLAQEPAGTAAVLSCQEMSPRIESMQALRDALPKGKLLATCPTHDLTALTRSRVLSPRIAGLEVYLRMGSASDASTLSDSLYTGFIYPTTSVFKDATDEVMPKCTKLMSEIGMPERVAATTLRKLCVGIFDFEGNGERKLAVINVHLKKAPGLAAKRALCLSGLLQIALNLEDVAEAVCAGDVNLDSEWPKELSQQACQDAAKRALPGMMPEPLLGQPRAFDEALRNEGLEQHPEYNVFTTIKMRTLFQGQPKETDKLKIAHKDVVVVRSAGRVRVLDTNVGGVERPKKRATNLDLLIPSREWPADHYLALCSAAFT